MEKKCTICKDKKSLSDFNKKKGTKDGKQPACRDCNKERSRAYYAKNREAHSKTIYQRTKIFRQELRRQINIYKSETGCSCCEENSPICLDFHHMDHEDKEDLVSRLIYMNSVNRLEKEIKKCCLLCSNCHRKHHADLIDISHAVACKFEYQSFGIKHTDDEYVVVSK